MTERHKLAMLLFISSEVWFFGSLIAAYVVSRTDAGASVVTPLLDVPRVVLFSLALFASSATMELAHRRLDRGDVRGNRNWLVITATLGVIFLVGQGLEFRELLVSNITLSAGVFASAFFTLTGFHGLHVLIGLILMVILAAVAGRIAPASRLLSGFVPISLYWHFVDAVWVVILSVVYLWAPR